MKLALVLVLPLLAVMVIAGLNSREVATVEAHQADNHIDFGVIGPEDADTIRKVTPRRLTIQAGQTVTFHVNGGGHQVVVLKPGVDIEDLGSEGVDANGIAPDTALAPESYPGSVGPATGLPAAGPGRWDANGNCAMGGAGDVLRPQVYFKQLCGPAATVKVDVPVTFTSPGRYVFICNLVAHYLDEGVTIAGPLGSVVFTGFGMHGEVEVVGP
jgi:plastocyanin